MTLSLCMIVKNEEDVLARALSNARIFADEIIVVDTGSDDGTKKIARELADKVYDFEWNDDFSAARNFAFSKATMDYRMWLDADDIVPLPSARAINRLMKKLDPDVDIVMLPYILETESNGKPKFSYYRERIMKNNADFVFRGAVHEAVALSGAVLKKSIAVYHAKPSGRSSGTRNLDIYRKMLAKGRALSARERYYYARELYYNGETSSAATEFEKFIDDPDGFYVNKIDACVMLSRCCVKNGDRKGAYFALYNSFMYDVPRGEAACELALLYFADGRYELAAYWFERAAAAKPDLNSGAFVDVDYYGFLPYVWLSVCYDKLGKQRTAYFYHCRARKLRPDHPSVVANQKYFEGLGYR